MKKLYLWPAVLSLILFLSFLSYSQVKSNTISGREFKGEISINASSQKIWNALTNMKIRSKFIGSEFKGGKETLKSIGDYAKLKELGDDGICILTFSKPAKELRYTWEVDNGSYLCQSKWILTESKGATKVMLVERYTESGKQTDQDIAQQEKLYNGLLQNIKKYCEGS
jgi:uncharacterized protein YndB with AHSA1/START domain